MSETSPESEPESADWKISLGLSLAVLLAAGGLATLTFLTEPTAEKSGAAKKTAMLVDVIEVDRGTHRPEIVAQGTVEPARDIVLRPQVGGRVTSITTAFTPGSHVEKGDLLLEIEAADYRNTLEQRESALEDAKAELTAAKGRHEAAKAEYERFGEDLPPDQRERVLRTPQLEAAKQRVRAARAAVEQAKLDLSRTSIEAPFDAHILRRGANVGSQISPDDDIGRLVGTDTYWVRIDLPLSKVRWVSVGEESGSRVRVRNKQAWPEESSREGRLYKKVGSLDGETRMIGVLAKIEDPLGLDGDQPSLTIREFVEATIEGNTIEDAVRLDRDYVREDDTVWIMKEGKLRVQDVEIAVRNSEYAYVTGGLESGAKVVTTNLSTVRDGAPLRLEASDGENASE